MSDQDLPGGPSSPNPDDVPPIRPATPDDAPLPGEPTTIGAPVPPPIPPPGPPPNELPHATDEPVPWYRRPGLLAAAIVGGLAALALVIAFFVWLFSDDDEGAFAENRLIIREVDQNGDPVQRELTAQVVGQPGDEVSWVWLIPSDATAPQPAVASTSSSSGEVEFRWGPTDQVEDPGAWRSTITLSEDLPAGWDLPGSLFGCTLERPGEDERNIGLNVIVDPGDLDSIRGVTFSFPDFEFVPGDTVRCEVGSVAPGATTTTSSTSVAETTTSVEETTTTIEETTTSVEETTTSVEETTTTVEETTTTAAETTTTVAETTTTVAELPEIVVPGPDSTVAEIIQASPGLSALDQLMNSVGFYAELDAITDPFTMLAPSNDAVAEAADLLPDDPEQVRVILRRHVVTDGRLGSLDLFALPQVNTLQGDVLPVDADAGTVGGAEIVVADQAGANTNQILHAIGSVILP